MADIDRRRVAVIAGTPVDTQMGIDFLRGKAKASGQEDSSVETVFCPVAEDCDAQVRFQYSDEDGKREVIDRIFDPEIAEGTLDFFIYCNSLSAAFDFDIYALRKSIETGTDVRIYTPLQIYRELGRQYSRLGVIAANNLSAHAIEEALMASNPDIYMIGSGNMTIVRAIEDGFEPDEIVRSCGLASMADYMQACGAEAVLLGCTHFPYIKEEFKKVCGVPVIDPADRMYEALMEAPLHR